MDHAEPLPAFGAFFDEIPQRPVERGPAGPFFAVGQDAGRLLRHQDVIVFVNEGQGRFDRLFNAGFPEVFDGLSGFDPGVRAVGGRAVEPDHVVFEHLPDARFGVDPQ